MEYRSVIWDWNGTLLDDLALSVEVVNGILRDHDLAEMSVERYREIFDFPVQLYWERAGLDLSRIDFAEFSKVFCARFEDGLSTAQLFASSTQVLDALAADGVEQFLLSNTEHGTLRRMAEHYGIASRFAGIRGMTDTQARGKASGARGLIEEHSLDRQSTVMIGDTMHDAEVAAEVGVDCFLVSAGHHPRARMCGVTVFDSLDALLGGLRAG